MADDQALDLEVSGDENIGGGGGDDDGSGKKGGSKLLLIIIAAVVVLLIGGGAAFFLLSGDSEEEAEMVAEEVVEEEKAPAMYIPLKPPFVTHFDDSGRKRYLQLELTLMTRSDDSYTAVIKHLPKIRSNILTLVAAQLFDELQSPEGKEIMRESLVEEIRTLMEAEVGDPSIEDVYYTTFIIQ